MSKICLFYFVVGKQPGPDENHFNVRLGHALKHIGTCTGNNTFQWKILKKTNKIFKQFYIIPSSKLQLLTSIVHLNLPFQSSVDPVCLQTELM